MSLPYDDPYSGYDLLILQDQNCALTSSTGPLFSHDRPRGLKGQDVNLARPSLRTILGWGGDESRVRKAKRNTRPQTPLETDDSRGNDTPSVPCLYEHTQRYLYHGLIS